MGMTFAEKVLARRAGLDRGVPGQIVIVEADHLLTHDAAAGTITVAGRKFSFPTLPPEILAIREARGLLPWTRAELAK